MDTQLDQDAVNLAKAIRQTESQGNFQAKGKSGEYGAYQFTEPTWNAYSKKYGVNVPLQQATPQQQNEVAYKEIKALKDKGHNVGEIASIWNSGKPDAYKDVNYKGVNKMGVTYDVPAYAKSVALAYQALKGGQQVPANIRNASSVGQPQFPLTSQKDITPPAQSVPPGGSQPIPGVMEQIHKGDILGAGSSAIRKFGNFITGGGTETLGNAIGTLGGLIYTGGKEALGLAPKGATAAYDTSAPSVGETTGAAIKTVGAAAGIKGLGTLATKAWGYAGAKAMTKALPYVTANSGVPAEAFATLSRTEQLNLLGQSLKGAQLGDAEIIGNAIKVLKPDASFIKQLMKYGGLTLVGEQVLKRLFGERIGSAVSTVAGLIKP